jgi:hypothetical protein
MRKNNMKRHAVVQPLDQSIKLIPLTKGENAIVDSRNFAWLNQWNWAAHTGGTNGSKLYAVRTDIQKDGSRKTIFMHRVILGMPEKKYDPRDVDHENGNGLDNRRTNIRPCTRPQNCANSPRKIVSRSGYKWVHFEPSHNRKPWKVIVGGRYIGHYESKEKAREASLNASQRIYEGFAHTL